MAWVELAPPAPSAFGKPVSITIVGRREGGSGASHAQISVKRALLEELGWNADGAFRVMLGGAELEGFLRIEADPKGAFAGKKSRVAGSLHMRLGRLAGMPNQRTKASGCSYEIVSGALVVRLPWGKPAAAKVAPAVVTGPRVRDVTSSLMGDPQPGRRGALPKRS